MKKYILAGLMAILFVGWSMMAVIWVSASSTTPQHIQLKATPAGAAFYDPFNSGASTPWTFYQGSHLFTSGILQINSPKTKGAYAYIRTNWVNDSVSADIQLINGLGSAAVGLRYNPTSGASYQARIYSDGTLAIEKYDSWFTWKQMVWMSTALPGTNINNIKLSVTNNVFVAYFNNNLFATYTDVESSLTNGGGIVLSMWDGTADFDNVTVYNPAKLDLVPPAITSGLTNAICVQGQSYTFSIAADGTGLVYLWKLPNGITAVGTNTYTITNIQVSDAGSYAVYVTNNVGNVSLTSYLSVGTTNILADCIHTGQNVTLVWCLNGDGTNPAVAEYKIYYGSGQITNWIPSVFDTNNPCARAIFNGTNWCRCYTNAIFVGNTNSFTLTNLPAGFTFYFAATTVGTNKTESDFSNEARYAVPVYTQLTNIFYSAITYIGSNIVQLSAKVCSDSHLTVMRRENSSWSAMVISMNPMTALFTTPDNTWSVIATNLTPDAYGNFFYNCYGTNNQRFFRLQLQ